MIQPVSVLWLAVPWMFVNIQIMIIISANLPASDLFDKENNIVHKGAVSALLKSSTKYSPELIYLQQSYYFALCHFSLFLFFSLPVFYFLFFFLFLSSSDDAFRTCWASVPPHRMEAFWYHLGHTWLWSPAEPHRHLEEDYGSFPTNLEMVITCLGLWLSLRR